MEKELFQLSSPFSARLTHDELAMINDNMEILYPESAEESKRPTTRDFIV